MPLAAEGSILARQGSSSSWRGNLTNAAFQGTESLLGRLATSTSGMVSSIGFWLLRAIEVVTQFESSSAIGATVDHVVPVSRGGAPSTPDA